MPAKAPTKTLTPATLRTLAACARDIRERRMAMGVSTTVAAHAAGMSRVTWHRIEKGEPSVTMAAYAGALDAMGLSLVTQAPTPARKATPLGEVPLPQDPRVAFRVPKAIVLEHYPQLRAIAWHVKADFVLTPAEAKSLYVRNARYLDRAAMPPHERQLFAALVPPTPPKPRSSVKNEKRARAL